MHGGRVFWALDNVNAELDSLRAGNGTQLTFPKKLNLDDILFKYGIRVNYNLIADLNSAEIPITAGGADGQAQIQLVPWLFYPVFIPTSRQVINAAGKMIFCDMPSSVFTLRLVGSMPRADSFW